MISPAQIRAARALLEWTQAELAKKTGISLRALNSIENGQAVPRIDSLQLIQQALEQSGVEFTEFDGTRRKTERLEIVKLEGAQYYDRHVHDPIQEMRTPGGEILHSFQSDEEYDDLNSAILDEYYAHIHRHDITERSLVARGGTWIMGMPSTYRWLRRDIFNHVGYMVYGQNVAFLIARPPHRMIIIRNSGIADMFRRQFEANWAMAETPWFAKGCVDEGSGKPWSSAKAASAREWIRAGNKRRNDHG